MGFAEDWLSPLFACFGVILGLRAASTPSQLNSRKDNDFNRK